MVSTGSQTFVHIYGAALSTRIEYVLMKQTPCLQGDIQICKIHNLATVIKQSPGNGHSFHLNSTLAHESSLCVR